MTRREIEIAISLEAGLVRRASMNLVSGKWLARSLREHYGVPAENIRVIPWGANIDSADVPNSSDIYRGSPGNVCSLLFLGTNWSGKGGDLAYETLQRLVDRGVPAELVVVGCQPPEGRAHEKIQVIGRLYKSDPADRRRISDLLRTSSFLLLPTRAECFGHVFCEAGAYGLPSITTKVGGVGEVVRDGENGMALPLSAGAEDYAETIAKLWFNHDEYRALSAGARRAFDERLNWDAWGRQVRAVLAEILDRDSQLNSI
jgi:glycosyltransferase involved in cell wall biosynthesis